MQIKAALFSFFSILRNNDSCCRDVEDTGNSNADAIGLLLNERMSGKTAPLSPPTVLYESVRIDGVGNPEFDGCTVTLPFDFSFIGTSVGGIKNPDQPGDAVVEGTWDINELENGKVCFTGLEVTSLTVDNSPDPVAEEFAKYYINEQLNDPECFEDGKFKSNI